MPCCYSVAKSYLTLRLYGLQPARLPCPPLSPRVCSSSCPLSQWCYLTISSSAVSSSVTCLTCAISLLSIITSHSDEGNVPINPSSPSFVRFSLTGKAHSSFVLIPYACMSQNRLPRPEDSAAPLSLLSFFYLTYLLRQRYYKQCTVLVPVIQISVRCLCTFRGLTVHWEVQIHSQHFPGCFHCVCSWGKAPCLTILLYPPVNKTTTGR